MDPGGHLFSLFQSSAVKHRQDGSEDERWVKRAQCCIWNLSSILALQWRNSFFSKWSKGEVYPVASAFCSSTLKCLAVARPGKCLQTSERSAFLPNELVLCLPKLSNHLSYLRGLIRRRQWHPTPVLLPWKIPWMEEPGRLQSMGSLRVGHDWVTSLSLFTFMHWRRKWQPTPVFLPGESQGRRGSLMGCRLWGRTESDTTEAT